VLFTSAISFLANFLQLSTYFRDRRRIREERAESAKLLREIERYRYIVGLAERQVKTEEQLKEVEQDVLEREQAAREVEQRMDKMRQVARHQMVQGVIDHTIQELLRAY